MFRLERQTRKKATILGHPPFLTNTNTEQTKHRTNKWVCLDIQNTFWCPLTCFKWVYSQKDTCIFLLAFGVTFKGRIYPEPPIFTHTPTPHTRTRLEFHIATVLLWLDELHFAPPKKPWIDDFLVHTMQTSWFPVVSKCCEKRISQPSAVVLVFPLQGTVFALGDVKNRSERWPRRVVGEGRGGGFLAPQSQTSAEKVAAPAPRALKGLRGGLAPKECRRWFYLFFCGDDP